MLGDDLGLEGDHLFVVLGYPCDLESAEVLGGVDVDAVVFVEELFHNVIPDDALADSVGHVGDVEYDRDVGYDVVVPLAVGEDELIVNPPKYVGDVFLDRFFLYVAVAEFVGVGDYAAAN